VSEIPTRSTHSCGCCSEISSTDAVPRSAELACRATRGMISLPVRRERRFNPFHLRMTLLSAVKTQLIKSGLKGLSRAWQHVAGVQPTALAGEVTESSGTNGLFVFRDDPCDRGATAVHPELGDFSTTSTTGRVGSVSLPMCCTPTRGDRR